jgi:hypothetical protein
MWPWVGVLPLDQSTVVAPVVVVVVVVVGEEAWVGGQCLGRRRGRRSVHSKGGEEEEEEEEDCPLPTQVGTVAWGEEGEAMLLPHSHTLRHHSGAWRQGVVTPVPAPVGVPRVHSAGQVWRN